MRVVELVYSLLTVLLDLLQGRGSPSRPTQQRAPPGLLGLSLLSLLSTLCQPCRPHGALAVDVEREMQDLENAFESDFKFGTLLHLMTPVRPCHVLSCTITPCHLIGTHWLPLTFLPPLQLSNGRLSLKRSTLLQQETPLAAAQARCPMPLALAPQ